MRHAQARRRFGCAESLDLTQDESRPSLNNAAIAAAVSTIGPYVAGAWLLLVAGNLVLGGHFDVAARDVVMSAAAFAFARLPELRLQAVPASPTIVSRTHQLIV